MLIYHEELHWNGRETFPLVTKTRLPFNDMQVNAILSAPERNDELSNLKDQWLQRILAALL